MCAHPKRLFIPIQHSKPHTYIHSACLVRCGGRSHAVEPGLRSHVCSIAPPPLPQLRRERDRSQRSQSLAYEMKGRACARARKTCVVFNVVTHTHRHTYRRRASPDTQLSLGSSRAAHQPTTTIVRCVRRLVLRSVAGALHSHIKIQLIHTPVAYECV